MSIDVGHIMRHSFSDFSNQKAVDEFVNESIEKIRRHFCLKEPIDIDIADVDEHAVELMIPGSIVMCVTLHHGFWFIDTDFTYYQFTKNPFLRTYFFDIASALGCTEGWTCEETTSWNCSKFDIYKESFDNWLNYATKKGIGDYEAEVVDGCVSEDKYIYYDSYKSLREELCKLQRRYPHYSIKCLSKIGKRFVRAEREGKMYLLDYETGKLLFDYPIDSIYEDYNGAGFVVWKGNLCRFVGNKGELLTPFMEGEFEWKWDSDKFPEFSIVVYNDKAGIEIGFDHDNDNYYLFELVNILDKFKL